MHLQRCPTWTVPSGPISETSHAAVCKERFCAGLHSGKMRALTVPVFVALTNDILHTAMVAASPLQSGRFSPFTYLASAVMRPATSIRANHQRVINGVSYFLNCSVCVPASASVLVARRSCRVLARLSGEQSTTEGPAANAFRSQRGTGRVPHSAFRVCGDDRAVVYGWILIPTRNK